jgi:hypothetical protein
VNDEAGQCSKEGDFSGGRGGEKEEEGERRKGKKRGKGKEEGKEKWKT